MSQSENDTAANKLLDPFILGSTPYKHLLDRYQSLLDHSKKVNEIVAPLLARFPFIKELEHDKSLVTRPKRDHVARESVVFKALIFYPNSKNADTNRLYFVRYVEDWKPQLIIARHKNPKLFGKYENTGIYYDDIGELEHLYVRRSHQATERWEESEFDLENTINLLGMTIYGASYDIANSEYGNYPPGLLNHLDGLLEQKNILV